jgi:hypothetical protein
MSAAPDFDADLAAAAHKVIGPDGPLGRAAHGRPIEAVKVMDSIFDGRYLMLGDETVVYECEPGFLRRALDTDTIVHNLIRSELVRCLWSDEHSIKTPLGLQPVYPLDVTLKGTTIVALWQSYSPDAPRR